MYECWYGYVTPKYEEKATTLYGCRQLYSPHKNRRHSGSHCKRC